MSTYSAFRETRLIVSGLLETVLRLLKKRPAHADGVLIFEDSTGRQVDFDFRGTIADVLERASPEQARSGPGRPKLGVVSREVSLLPRHWDWLEIQPHGISAAVRRLVEEARKRDPEGDRTRLALEATSRFMTVMAGNLPHFEEASRALFAEEHQHFTVLTRKWPKDIRRHLARLLRPQNAGLTSSASKTSTDT